MYRVDSNIIVGTNIFESVAGFETISSWQTFADNCTLTLPNKFYKNNQEVILEVSHGDEVVVQAGWYPNLNTEFLGYVSAVTPDNIMTITCQDAMWLLKQKTVKKFSGTNLTLKSLITQIWALTGLTLPFTVIDAKIGDFRISNASITEILDTLKSKFGLSSFIRNGVLIIGLAYEPTAGTNHIFYFNGDKCNIIESSLEYRKITDNKIVVKGVSINSTTLVKTELYAFYNSLGQIEVSATQEQGSTRTLNYIDFTIAELTTALERELPNLVYEGYYGGFTTFGEPYVKHGDNVTLIDNRFPERQGIYLVKEVMASITVEAGYTRSITLDRKI